MVPLERGNRDEFSGGLKFLLRCLCAEITGGFYQNRASASIIRTWSSNTSTRGSPGEVKELMY